MFGRNLQNSLPLAGYGFTATAWNRAGWGALEPLGIDAADEPIPAHLDAWELAGTEQLPDAGIVHADDCAGLGCGEVVGLHAGMLPRAGAEVKVPWSAIRLSGVSIGGARLYQKY